MRKISLIILIASIVVVLCALANPVHSSGKYTDESYIKYCEEIGEEYHICPELLEAIYQADLKRDDLVGPMKLNPDIQQDRMDRLDVSDLSNSHDAILVGADYLLSLFEQNDDLYIVLQAYLGYDPSWGNDYIDEIVMRSQELEGEHNKLNYN